MGKNGSAKAIITGFLATYGLDALGDWAWQQYLTGASVEQIMLDIKDQPAYQARFPAMAALAKDGAAISEREYIDYEISVRSMLHNYAITPGLYDTAEGIADLLTNRVSASEVNSRLQRAAAAAYSTPPEVLDALRAQGYTLDGGSLASFYLDPDRALPMIEQQYAAAQVTGAARQQSLDIAQAEAARLAANGVTWQQAQQGFGEVAATRLLGSGAGEQADQNSRVRAVFGDAAARQQVTRVQQSRRARFAGGGSAAETQQGVSGLGGAST